MDPPSKLAGSGGNHGTGGGGSLEGSVSAFKPGVVDADSTLQVAGGEGVEEGASTVYQQYQEGAEDKGKGSGVPNPVDVSMCTAAAVANTGVSENAAPPVHESRSASSPTAGDAPEASSFQQVMDIGQDIAASPAAAERLPTPKAAALPTTRSLPHLVKVGGGLGASLREGPEGGDGDKGRLDEHGPTKAQLVAAALKGVWSLFAYISLFLSLSFSLSLSLFLSPSLSLCACVFVLFHIYLHFSLHIRSYVYQHSCTSVVWHVYTIVTSVNRYTLET